MADIEIEINGRKLNVKSDQTIIQAADDAGIYIPRFCYHKHLSIAANCRMCLVEVEKSPKTVPACATPVMPGMKVFTKSQKTILAQRAVMEFLLINHPLDCPICDQGGECELQDLSMGYGASASQYDECKRAIADEDLGPLISTDMTRCIYCTRCVRFGDEIAGLREMGGTFRGEHTEIGTYIQHAIKSEVSGNIIDLCPVGALTSKPYRYTARAWELDQAPGVSPHDAVGANLHIHTRYGKVMRVVPRENAIVNETWIADRDRYSYTGLYHADRLSQPMARIDGKWKEIEWEKAFELLTTNLNHISSTFGADQIGALASPSATLEEYYLLQKIMRAIGSSNIDHRLREKDTHDQADFPLFPGLGMTMAELESSEAILLIGSHIQKEQPLIDVRLRKATQKGAMISIINPVDYDFHFPIYAKKIIAPHHVARALAAVINALSPTFSEVAVDEEAEMIAASLTGKKKVTILLGALALQHDEAATIRALSHQLAKITGATVSLLTQGANSAGAYLAGAIPHRSTGGVSVDEPGLSATDMLNAPRKAYILLNVEPDLDYGNPHQAKHALHQAEFVVALSLFRNPVIEAEADLILPMAAFTETSGTFINLTGEWQSFKGVANAYEGSRPAWKILRVLGNFLNLEGFDYESTEQVKAEILSQLEHHPVKAWTFSSKNTVSFAHHDAVVTRIGEVPIYAIDSLVRRANPLQTMQNIMEPDVTHMKIHPETAQAYALSDGDVATIQQAGQALTFKVRFDTRIAKEAVWLASGIQATAQLGDAMGVLHIQQHE